MSLTLHENRQRLNGVQVDDANTEATMFLVGPIRCSHSHNHFQGLETVPDYPTNKQGRSRYNQHLS